MFQTLLRAALLILLAVLVARPTDAFARGPGGGGGRGGKGGGARAGGGLDGNQKALTNQGRKKKSGPKVANGSPNFNATGGNLNGIGQAFSGKAGNAQNLNGAMQHFQGGPGALQNGEVGVDKFQSLQNQAGQKFQARDGQYQQNAQQKWQSRNGEFQQNAHSAVNDFQNGPQPFTADWYADHPAAWQQTHPHADAWAAATATGVAAWLGWAAYPQTYGTSSTTVYYEQAPAEVADESDEVDDNQTAADENDVASHNDTGEWLSLGVYSVLSDSGEPTSRMLQLNVNRQGELRGVYYDAISNTSQNLSGNLDQKTRLAQWSLVSNPQITFRAGLDELAQPSGAIEVNQPGGQQKWQVARQPTANK